MYFESIYYISAPSFVIKLGMKEFCLTILILFFCFIIWFEFLHIYYQGVYYDESRAFHSKTARKP
jgi:hypothetical protein